MLKSRNLDDQTYRQIVEAAESRLPWLCPEWTDHNAHDPGITLLELMAWYKEMQQYRLNQFTEELLCKLLKLAGITRRPAAAAHCMIAVGTDSPARPVGSRLRTREGIPFELLEAVPEQNAVLARICVEQGDRLLDVGELLRERRMTFQPFSGAEPSRLKMAFSRLGTAELRLWFDVAEPEGVARNPFSAPEQRPRVLQWDCPGGVTVRRDDTHAFSQSGYVYLQPTAGWKQEVDGFWWLTVSLTDPGCEENVRLSGICTDCCPARQQETWAESHCFQAPAQADWTVYLKDALSWTGTLAVFLRRSDGWVQTSAYQTAQELSGRRVQLDTTEAVQDGGDNVRLVVLESERASELLFDAKGLPGETVFLHLDGRTVLTESFTLLCETLERDGTVHPAPWHCVEELSACGARDRVFTYDPVRETVTFGDGEHGARLHGGKGAILAARLVLSQCSGGNIPAGTQLRFEDDGTAVRNGNASGGAERETAEEARKRLLQQLGSTRKCVSAADYERLARATPGLRVAAVKALPAYDPEEPTGVSRTPTVTVVVIPSGSGEDCPLPDARFLAAVSAQLNRCRPIGTQVRVIPPIYIGLSIRAETSGGETQEAVRRVRAYLTEQVGIGGTVRVEEIAACLQAMSGAERIGRIEVQVSGNGCRQNGTGDVELPRQAVPWLKALTLERLSAGGTAR